MLSKISVCASGAAITLMSGIIYLQAGEEIQENFVLCSTFTLNPAGTNTKETNIILELETNFPFKQSFFFFVEKKIAWRFDFYIWAF